jgi:GntR family transcriptional regulator, transcriptional repressor for pyruvate dehydrogenase complex
MMLEPDRQRQRVAPRYVEIAPRIDTRADKMAEIVARQLVHDVITKGLLPGENVDSEQALIDRFAVSRESVREALRLLEVAGLLTIRRGPGGGAFVGTVDPANLGRFSSLYFHMAGATYAELFEAYAMAEALLARRAASHADAVRRAEAMSSYLTDSSDEPDLQHFITHHAGFHAAVAALSNNRVLQITFQSLGLLVGRHYVALAEAHSLTLDSARADRPFVEEDHLAIAAAIKAGRPRLAHDLMEAHVQHIVTVLEADGLDRNDVVEWV